MAKDPTPEEVMEAEASMIADAFERLQTHKDYPQIVKAVADSMEAIKDAMVSNATPETLVKYQAYYSALNTLLNILETTHESLGVSTRE